MITVFLEDHGQDFLEWDIEDGVVVDCRPFQGWVWVGAKVHNPSIQPGDILEITPKTGTGYAASFSSEKKPAGRRRLNYPVERVEEKASV